MKTVVITIWYFLLSIDGVERIEGPTPEICCVEVNDTEWGAIRSFVDAWEQEHNRTVVVRVEKSCNKGKCIYPVHRDDVPDCLHCEHCHYGAKSTIPQPIISSEKCRFPGQYENCFRCPVNGFCSVGDLIAWTQPQRDRHTEYPPEHIALPEGCIAKEGTAGAHMCTAAEVHCDLIVSDNRPCKAERYQEPEDKDVCERCIEDQGECQLEKDRPSGELPNCPAGRC